MPETNGIALTKMIREKEKNPGSSIVIMISSADFNSVEAEAKNAGVNKFLMKPFFPSAIAEVISQCIGIIQENSEERSTDINGIFEGRRILLAEDIDINREIVLTLLEPTLLKIDCAENGAKAVEMFSRTPEKYDMIFMDVQMPEMDGYEATRQIRGLNAPNAQSVPVIAMTANVFRDDIERCLAAGMNAHLSKPFNLNDLIEKLRKYII
jgi:CheY-like chemotaxis protein